MNASWNSVRDDFPILHQQINGKPLIYLDNAATAQKPKVVIDALSSFYLNDNANVHRGLHTLSMRSTNAYALVERMDKVCKPRCTFALSLR